MATARLEDIAGVEPASRRASIADVVAVQSPQKTAALQDLETPPVDQLPSQQEFDAAHQAHVDEVVRGLGAYNGGQLPAMPAAPIPPELRAGPRPSDAPDFVKAAYEGKYGVPAPASLGTAFREPAEQIEQGVERIAGAESARDIAGGASGVIRGTLGGVGGPESIGPMIAAAPVGAALSLGSAALAQKGTEAGLKAAGVPEDYSSLAGDVAGLIAGGGGAAYLLRRAYKAAGSPEVKLGKFEEAKPFREMTDEELVNQANAIERERPKNYEWQKRQIVQEAARRQAERGMGAAAEEPGGETPDSALVPARGPAAQQAPSEAIPPKNQAVVQRRPSRKPASGPAAASLDLQEAAPEAEAAAPAEAPGKALEGKYPVGNTVPAKVAKGYSVPTRYAVVPVEDLVTSHGDDFDENPGYPQEVQPRDRSRKASKAQVQAIYQNVDPAELAANHKASDGAPIVGEDLVVESGNGRTMALRKLYANRREYAGADKYKSWMVEHAPEFGLDSEDVQAMDSPVLVRVRGGELPYGVTRADFARHANEAGTAAMSPTEHVEADAAKITGPLMEMFQPGDDGDVMAASNRDFTRGFFDRVVGRNERGQYMTSDGTINQAGVRRIQNAIFHRTYGSAGVLERMAESPDSGIRNITTGMLQAAPRLASMREGIARGTLHDRDIAPDVAAAAAKVAHLRESGETIANYLAQENMFGDDLTPEARTMVQVFAAHARAPRRIGEILQSYADAVEAAGNPNQEGLFGGTIKPSKAELLTAAVRRVERGHEEAKQQKTVHAEVREGQRAGGPDDHEADAAAQEAARSADLGRRVQDAGAVEPRLPRLLAGAKPNYSFGLKRFSLTFESDVDKAAYIAAQHKKSKQDSAYLKFAMDATGLGEQAVRRHGERVRAAIKAQASGAEPGALTVPRQEVRRQEGERGGISLRPKRRQAQMFPTFDADAQREAEAAAQRKLEGDRLSAEFHAPLARPRGLKPAKPAAQTDLFRDTPEPAQRSLFGSERGAIPVSPATVARIRRAAEPAIELARAGRDFLLPAGSLIGRQGPLGAKLAKLIDRAFDVGEVAAGKRLVGLRDAGLAELTRPERLELLDALEGRNSNPSQKVADVRDEARAVLDEMAVEAVAHGVRVDYTATVWPGQAIPPGLKLNAFQLAQLNHGKPVRVRGKRAFVPRQNYFPHVIPRAQDLKERAIGTNQLREDVMENLVRGGLADKGAAAQLVDAYVDFLEKGGRQQNLIDYLKQSGQARDDAEALAQLQRFRRRSIKSAGSIEHAREIDLPFWDPDPARVLPGRIAQGSVRLAQIRYFGQENQRINSLINGIRNAGGDAELTRTAFDRIMSMVNEPDTPGARLGRAFRVWNGFKLGLSGIANSTQGALNTFLASDLPATIAGAKGLASKSGRRFAIESGAALESVIRESMAHAGADGRALGKFLEATGFSPTERANRIFAANAGANYAKRLLARYQANWRDTRARDVLTELGIDARGARARGALSADEVLTAAKKFSDLTQFRSRPQDLPLFASTPAGKVFFQLKSYIYGQTRLIGRELIGELRAGRPGRAFRTLLVAGLVFPIAGELVKDVRALIQGRERESGLLKRYLEDISAVGAVGVLGDLVEAGRYQRGVEFLAGPTIGEAGWAIDTAASGRLGKAAFRRIPLVGPLLAERLFPRRRPMSRELRDLLGD